MVAPALAGASLAPRTVLVVDDDAPLRALCCAALGEAGFRVLEAADGAEALELIARDRPDLILLDVMMPRLSGWAVAAELLAEPATGEIPIVFISGRREPADRLRAQELRASGYVTKPFDPAGLATTVGTVPRRDRSWEARVGSCGNTHGAQGGESTPGQTASPLTRRAADCSL